MNINIKTHNLFAYGTLINLNLQQKLFNRILLGKADILNGYAKLPIVIDGEIFTCIKEEENNFVEGNVYQLFDNELLMADVYEGEEYTRIDVVLQSGIKAWVYVALN